MSHIPSKTILNKLIQQRRDPPPIIKYILNKPINPTQKTFKKGTRKIRIHETEAIGATLTGNT